jgi:hypothetical protein
MDPKQQFVSSLPVIDRIIALLVRRHALAEVDAADFASWAKARLIEDDYKVFRAFGGRSSLSTYLTVVLTMLLRQYRSGGSRAESDPWYGATWRRSR